MQIVSAYLLAASAVDSGNYDEDYDIDIDPSFEEYMDIAGDEIVGDYIELNAPTGGTEAGSFSGDQFCGDWLSAFVCPIEYAKIYANKAGINPTYPSTSDESEWNGFIVVGPQGQPHLGEYIPRVLDEEVYNDAGKHVNLWLATFAGYTQYNPDDMQARLYGFYVGDNVSFKCVSNQPTRGFASFSMTDIIGSDIGQGAEYLYSHGWIATGGWGENYGGQASFPTTYILVYNVSAFKNYLNTMTADDLQSFLVNHLFALAECNVYKEKA